MTIATSVPYQAKQVRVTVFVQSATPMGKEKYDKLWDSIGIGVSDTHIQKNNAPSVYQKKYEDGTVVLQYTKSRFDLVYAESDAETLGLSNVAFGIFDSIMQKLFKNFSFSYITRVAFGCNLYINHKSHDEVLNSLREKLIGKAVLPTTLNDFTLRLNIPVPSVANPKYWVNRIAEWSAVQQVLVEVDVVGGQHERRQLFVEQLALDINNVIPDPVEVFNMERAKQFYEEFSSIAGTITRDAHLYV